jgi:hypothetical protein
VGWLSALFNRGRPPAGGQPSAAPERASGRDWVGLPPIQRAAADLQMTAPALEFARGLPGPHGQQVMLQPLGHARSPEAPAGLVSGLASAATVQRYGSADPLVYRQVQRSRSSGFEPAAAEWPEPAASSTDLSFAADLEEAEPLPEAGPPATQPQALGTADMPSMPPPAPSPCAVALTVPQASRQPLTVSRLIEAPVPPPALLLPVVPERPRAEPAGEEAPPMAPAFPPPAVQASALEDAAAAPLPRLNLGQSRRLGLGPPLESTPPAVQRMTDESTWEPSRALEEVAGPAPAESSAIMAANPVPAPIQHAEPSAAPALQRSLEVPRVADLPRQHGAETTLSAGLGSPIVRVQRSRDTGPTLAAGQRPAPDPTAELALPLVPPFLGGEPAEGTEVAVQPTSGPAPEPASPPLELPAVPAPAGAGSVTPALPAAEPAAPEPAEASPAAPAVPDHPSAPAPGPEPALGGRPSWPAAPISRTIQRMSSAGVEPATPGAPSAPILPPLSGRPIQRAMSGEPPQPSWPSAPVGPSGPSKPVENSGAARPVENSGAARPVEHSWPTEPSGSAESAEPSWLAASGPWRPAPASTPANAGTSAVGGGGVLPLVAARTLATPSAVPLAMVAQRTTSDRAAAARVARAEPAQSAQVNLPAGRSSSPAWAAGAFGATASGGAYSSGPEPAAPDQLSALVLAPPRSREPAGGLAVQALHDAGFDATFPLAGRSAVSASSGAVEKAVAAAPFAEQPGALPGAAGPGDATGGALFAQPALDAPAAPTSGFGASPAVAAAGADPAPPAAPSEGELDDLAHRLYDRLRSRLRLELLIDRERAGLITDLR